MAKVMEIGDVVRKCTVLLLDIEGTTTSIGFVKDKLFPYAEENVKAFLEKHWETDDTKEAVIALRKQATEDHENSIEGYVAIAGEDASKEAQIESLVKNVKWQMSVDRKVGPLKQLQGAIWKEGYDKGNIKGHVYDDVSPALELWRSTEGKKVFIYSSGSVQAQKLLFSKSLVGDMLPLIDGHFDTAVGAKQEAASYAAIVEKIGCKAEEILFLTDIVQEAEAARTSGLQAALVSREGNAPLPADTKDTFFILHSFDQLAVTNKRKPDPQVEEVPAKVPKTDVQDDVKSASNMDMEATNGSSEMSEAVKTSDHVEPTETMEVDTISSDSAVEGAAAEVSDDVPMTDSALIGNDSENKTMETVSTIEVVKTGNGDTFTAEDLVEASEVSDSKVEEMKSAEIIEAKTKMVDAATVTDSAKTVDAATETILESAVEEPELKVEAPELKSVESPELKPVETSELKSVAAPIEQTVAVEVPANADVDSKSDEEATAVKTEIVNNNGIKPDDAKSVETSEDKTITNGSTAPEASIKESITVVEADVAKCEDEKTATSAPKEKTVEHVTDKKESAEVPESITEPIIKEVEENMDIKETEVIKTQVSTTAMDAETVSESSAPIEDSIAEALIEETIEIKDITDDKQSLEEVAESIEDIVPIVEEPSSNLEAEALQNAGDVLEKECDEILSKVQDVTNLSFIPVKALHTITEEMETESADSNDIVDRILDTEMELSIIKQGVDQNMAQEMNEPKIEAVNKVDVVEKKANEAPEESVHMSVDTNEHPPEKKNGDVIETTMEPTVEKMEAEVTIPEGNAESVITIGAGNISKAQESNIDSQIAEPTTKSDEPEQKPKSDEPEQMAESDVIKVVASQETTENSTEKAKIEDVKDAKVNGKAKDAPTVKLNGNSSPDDDLKSRLAAENGKGKVNGSNGDSPDAENGQGDNKMEAEIAEIKTIVKTVATDDMPVTTEQPVEG